MGTVRKESRRQELLTLSERLGVTFRDLGLLDQALTHTSYANESKRNTAHNERLEFLGDAVLELASSTYLYEHFPEMPEGELTRTRASIVCSTTLAGLAAGLGLGDYLLLGHGEEMGGGRTRQTNLEDVFEAVIGAVYLDQGWAAAKDYVVRQLRGEFQKAERGAILKDYKTILQERVFRREGQSIVYRLVREAGPDHDKSFTFEVVVTGKVMGEGTGRSKKEAEQHAARMALERLEAKKYTK
ncbi:ribonuclease III [Mitsuokella sp. AF21-1AC]|uniref:ribonuclease III n=1 Tax=Mitsuokella sp. AF21-1AC TaxID=2292235 RepID=UPI000E555A60|nr:ribonuclease III [Mitsuokella sp. AF21-1AC]RGS74741.1 ribonuclease III [Mitsuokella sp. AF21-1AC]